MTTLGVANPRTPTCKLRPHPPSDTHYAHADSEEYYAAHMDVPLTRTALRHAFALDTLRRATDGLIFAYPDSPAFAVGEHVDGHGVTYRFITGETEAALTTGVTAGIIPTDGSAVPAVSNAHGELVSGPAAGPQRNISATDGGQQRHISYNQ